MQKILLKAKKIKLLILDVDGVLTDGTIYLDNHGIECKGFHSRDGIGIKLLLKAGLNVAIISGRESKAVNHRLNALGVIDIYQNQNDKMIAFNKLKDKYNLSDEEIAYIGDDLPDLPPIKHAGLGITVNNGANFVKEHADLITTLNGGKGAVREICELLLQAQNKLTCLEQQYLS